MMMVFVCELLLLIGSTIGQDASVVEAPDTTATTIEAAVSSCVSFLLRRQNEPTFAHIMPPKKALPTGPRRLGGSACSYSCPVYSYKSPDVKCPSSFDHCVCADGFYKDYGTCIKHYDYCDYTCPAYSSKRSNVKCFTSFDDCVCDSGYHKQHGKCVLKCNFSCPAYSSVRYGVQCLSSFDDCDCDHGYHKENGYCVPSCGYYTCPAYSHKRYGVQCLKSYDDCDCDHGYYKHDGKCVPTCDSSYTCPLYSHKRWCTVHLFGPCSHCYR
jgi:hypothetical protein